MPLWGILAIGVGAVFSGWLLGSKKITQSATYVELVRLAKDWDKLTLEQQAAVAQRVAHNLINSGNKAAMELGADFLEDMDRPAEAGQLRATAAALP